MKEKIKTIVIPVIVFIAVCAGCSAIITAIITANSEKTENKETENLFVVYEQTILPETSEITTEPETEEETTAFETPVEDLGDTTTAEYEDIDNNSYNQNVPLSNESESTADEFTLLCQMVRIECGEGEGEEYYQECYLQAAVALNRLSQGWGDTLTEVLMSPGQFYGWGYDTYDWSTVNINIPDLQQAVLDCLAYNNTPENLVFADSRHNHEGTDIMNFYMEICGQDFYLSK